MPPRYRDLTEEEIDELIASGEIPGDLPRASVPRLPSSGARDAASPYRVDIGEAQLLDAVPGANEAWIDELIGRPEPAPTMLRAAGPGGGFMGEDTPQARALIQQRGMQPTTPPSDDELLDPSAYQRPAAMPDVQDDDWLDALIGQEGAEMDREQAAASSAPAQQRRSREDELLELLSPPTRMQGIAALIGDAFLGGDRVSQVQGRQRGYEGALAQARMQDVAAGEKAAESAADREMADARLGVTLRGQDLADARSAASLSSAERRAEMADQRQRELQTQRDAAAKERAQIIAAARARGEAPQLSPQEERAGLANYLAGEANTSLPEAEAYLAGKTEGLAPGKAERLRGIDAQLKTLPPAQRATTMAQALGRVSADRDRKEPERLESRNELLALHRKVNEAEAAWKAMSDKDKRVLATVGGGDSWLASTARDAMLSAQGQKLAASIQALADMQIKLQSGASVTANEWRRVATEIGLPKDAFSPFNATDSIDSWIKKSKDGFRDTYDSTLSTYPDLFDGMQGAR